MTEQSAQPNAQLPASQGLTRPACTQAALACALVLAAVSAADHVQAKELLRIGHFPNITHVQALVARAMERKGQNFLASRLGPDVTIEWYAYNAGPSAMEAIFARSIDLTYVGPNPALNAHMRSRGTEVRVIAGAVNGASGLVVHKDGGLTRPSDFRGKRIGTPQFGNTQDVAARAWLTAGGLRITQTGGDAQVVPTANPDQLALFKRKGLDAVWTVEPWLSRLELEGGGKLLLEEKDAVTTILVARAGFIAERRDLVRRFVAAHRELTEWVARNPEVAQHMARDELRVTFRTAFSAELFAHAWPRMTATGDTSLAAFQKFAENANAAGFLRTLPDLSRLIETP
jgi:NitT/TauT family transport system substrate-binding protein